MLRSRRSEMAFLICYVLVGAVLGMVKEVSGHILWCRRAGVPVRSLTNGTENRVASRALVWAVAWPLFLPLLFWGKR